MTNKTVNRAALAKIAGIVRPALATQAYIPALTHINFFAGFATAYNDVAAIGVATDADLKRCVPGDLLIKALSSFGGESIAIQDGKDGALLLSSGRSKLKVPTLPPADFPFKWSSVDNGGTEIELDSDILKGIERCLISVGSDATHPAQMGVTLDVDKRGHAVLYSTDNFTISRYQTKEKIELPGGTPVILPTFFCEQLIGLAKNYKEELAVLSLLPDGLLAYFGDFANLFTKTLVDLEPLDFPRIVEKHCKPGPGLKDDLCVIPDSFDGALNRALLVLGGEVDKSTKFECTDDSITMTTTASMGDSTDTMPFSGASKTINDFLVDPQLLARAARVCTSMAFFPKVVVLADADANFLHLVAHCNR